MPSPRKDIGDFLESVDSGILGKDAIDRNLEEIERPQSRDRALAGIELLNILAAMNVDANSSGEDRSTDPVSLRSALDAREDEGAILCGGIQIDRYELIEQLGRGGCGAVFRATDTLLGRTVALKVPAILVVADDDSHQRFLNEARLAAQLKHPNIVAVYGAGSERGVWYIASEYCRGPNLAQVIANPSLLGRSDDEPESTDRDLTYTSDQASNSATIPARTAARIVADLADAVGHAHQHGVLHRDIKPANVMIDGRGNHLSAESSVGLDDCVPKLTDFGLAKLIEQQDASLTASGMRVGTVAYMAPEQIEADASQIGFGADIYGLGNLLYELLTGEPPFGHGFELATLNAIRNEHPPRPRSRNASIPAPLESAAMRCLEKAPEDRFGSADELATALRSWLDGAAVRGGVLASWPSRRRSQIRAAWGVLVALTLAASIAGATLLLPNSTRESIADNTGIDALRPDPLLDIRNQLVTYLPLTGGLLDESGNRVHASVGGGDPQFSDHVGRAIEFDGDDDFLTLGYPESLRFGDESSFSVLGWVFLIGDQSRLRNANPFSSGADVTLIGSHRIVDRFTRVLTDSPVYEDVTETAGWGFEIIGGKQVRILASNGQRYRASPLRDFPRNRWEFFGLVFDRETDEMEFWVAGEVTGRFPVPPGSIDSFANGHSINIGQDGTGIARNCLHARIRHLAIWRRALKHRETRAVYQAGMDQAHTVLTNANK